MLAANSRMTYSLAVIMLETTQSINNFLPITLGIAVALVVGRIFNRSQYDYAIRSKQLPVLQHHMPKETGRMRVREIFLDKLNAGYELEVLESVSTVQRIQEVILKPFHSFPVVNLAGKVIGLISKNVVIVLIEQHCWYEHKDLERKQPFLFRSVSDRTSSTSSN